MSKHIITLSFGGLLKIWDYKGNCLRALEDTGVCEYKVLNDTIMTLSKAPEDCRESLCFGYEKGKIKIWNLDGKCLFADPGKKESFHQNWATIGKKVMVCTYGGIIKIFDMESRHCFDALSTGDYCKAFATSGNTVVAENGRGIHLFRDERPEKERQKMLAFAAALHDRCGQNSPANVLSHILLKEIGNYVIPEPWDP